MNSSAPPALSLRSRRLSIQGLAYPPPVPAVGVPPLEQAAKTKPKIIVKKPFFAIAAASINPKRLCPDSAGRMRRSNSIQSFEQLFEFIILRWIEVWIAIPGTSVSQPLYCVPFGDLDEGQRRVAAWRQYFVA